MHKPKMVAGHQSFETVWGSDLTPVQVSADPQTIREAVVAEDDPAEAQKWLSTRFYDLHADDPRQWDPMDRALQD